MYVYLIRITRLNSNRLVPRPCYYTNTAVGHDVGKTVDSFAFDNPNLLGTSTAVSKRLIFYYFFFTFIRFSTHWMLQSSTASYRARARYTSLMSSHILAFAIVVEIAPDVPMSTTVRMRTITCC